MPYRVEIGFRAAAQLEELDAVAGASVERKIQWLAENAVGMVHRRLVGMPEDLAGLSKLRVGDYQSLRKFVPSAPGSPSPSPPFGTEERAGERRRLAMVTRFAWAGHPSPRSCLTGRGRPTRYSLRRLRHDLSQRLIPHPLPDLPLAITRPHLSHPASLRGLSSALMPTA